MMRTKLLALLAAALLLGPSPAHRADRPDGDADRHGDRRERSGPARRHGHGDERIAHRRARGSAVTDENGAIASRRCRPATYEVTAELSGFKTITQQEARLQLGQTITLDAKLEVGGLDGQRHRHRRRTRRRREVLGGAEEPDRRRCWRTSRSRSRFGPGAMLLAPGVNPNNYSSYGSGGCRRTPT